MGAFDLIRELRGAGVVLHADGGTLDISPVDRLTDEMIEALKQHKFEILALLKNEDAQLFENAAQPKPRPDRQREASRQKAIAMLNASPDAQRAIYPDTEIDPDNVVLFVASRVYQQTCELLIPRAKYDPFKLLALVERIGAAAC